MLVPRRFQQWVVSAVIGSFLGVTGCSAARRPEAAVAQADLAVQQAAQSKAPLYAPTEFRVAQEKTVGAHEAMAADKYERSRRLAEQAVVDAQLAQARAEAADAQKNTDELRRTINALESEANRPTTP